MNRFCQTKDSGLIKFSTTNDLGILLTAFNMQPIVVPWDYSEMSKAELDKAIEIAESKSQIEDVRVTTYPAAMEQSNV